MAPCGRVGLVSNGPARRANRPCAPCDFLHEHAARCPANAIEYNLMKESTLTKATKASPAPQEAAPAHGYVPGFATADGNEDPAPPAVTHSTQPEPQAPAGEEEDGRFEIAEEVSFDLQSDQARRVGQMPLDLGPAGTMPQPADAVAQTLTAADAAAEPDSGAASKPPAPAGPAAPR